MRYIQEMDSQSRLRGKGKGLIKLNSVQEQSVTQAKVSKTAGSKDTKLMRTTQKTGGTLTQGSRRSASEGKGNTA